MFARWGIPEVFVSDNGGQFASESFKKFALQYGFRHIYTSPHFPQANGEAGSAVKIAKRILRQPDVFLALMAYRSTPVTATGVSPSELIMGRKLRTTVPISSEKLKPEWPDFDDVQKRDALTKSVMRDNYNRLHGVRTSWVTAVTPTDRPKSVRNSCVIKVFGGVFMLSRCFLDCSVGVGVFVTGLSQISSFFSYTRLRLEIVSESRQIRRSDGMTLELLSKPIIQVALIW